MWKFDYQLFWMHNDRVMMPTHELIKTFWPPVCCTEECLPKILKYKGKQKWTKLQPLFMLKYENSLCFRRVIWKCEACNFQTMLPDKDVIIIQNQITILKKSSLEPMSLVI